MSTRPEDLVERSSGAGPAFRRALLKLSGESLMGSREYGVDPRTVTSLAREVLAVQSAGTELAVVVGGGNFYRGMSAAAEGMDRATADYAGMLATLLNALAFQDALERLGAQTRVQSAVTVSEVAEPYIRRRAIRHLEKGRVVIVACGTGTPYFTTDTAAALRANELGCEVVLKATKVEGVYSKDPHKHPDAEVLHELTYLDVINRHLEVMDKTAITMCMENDLPLVVFNMEPKENLQRVLRGDAVGTIITGG